MSAAAPQFFIPILSEADWDEAYIAMAETFGGTPQGPGQRIYSLAFRHNDCVVTATVGEVLRGTRTVAQGRGRSRREIEVPMSWGETVLAIYDGTPHIIVHDNARPHTWNLPIYAGDIVDVVRFSNG